MFIIQVEEVIAAKEELTHESLEWNNYVADGFGISPNGDLILLKGEGGKNTFGFAAGSWRRVKMATQNQE